MGVSLCQYRACIGNFHLKCLNNCSDSTYYWSFLYVALCVSLYVKFRKILLSNDVSPNPGPVPQGQNTVHKKVCVGQVNMRSIVAELDSNHKALNERPPKVIELEAFCNEHNVDILGLSETWCKNTHTDRLIKIDSLPKIFRRDRNDRIGGGLALYASDDINIRRLRWS